MVVSEKSIDQDILAQMLMGFGVSSIQRIANIAGATAASRSEVFDLALIDSGQSECDGFALAEAIRRQNDPTLRQLPIVLILGHVRPTDVVRARDCGANLVLTKPFSPQILFDRILWIAQDHRKFIETTTYVGPDRRFKAFGPPLGTKGRRKDDLSATLGEAVGANLSQDAVDDFFAPKRVSV